jgi:hypothetical protein
MKLAGIVLLSLASLASAFDAGPTMTAFSGAAAIPPVYVEGGVYMTQTFTNWGGATNSGSWSVGNGLTVADRPGDARSVPGVAWAYTSIDGFIAFPYASNGLGRINFYAKATVNKTMQLLTSQNGSVWTTSQTFTVIGGFGKGYYVYTNIVNSAASAYYRLSAPGNAQSQSLFIDDITATSYEAAP